MYGFQVGYTLRVVVKEPAGEFQDGEFVGADEHHFILNVCAHTPRSPLGLHPSGKYLPDHQVLPPACDFGFLPILEVCG